MHCLKDELILTNAYTRQEEKASHFCSVPLQCSLPTVSLSQQARYIVKAEMGSEVVGSKPATLASSPIKRLRSLCEHVCTLGIGDLVPCP